MFRIFEIKDGKFTALPDIRPGKIKNILSAIIIIFLISSVAGVLKIEERTLWEIYSVVIHHFDLEQSAPEIDHDKKVEAEIKLEVDKAIREYEDLTGPSEPSRIPLSRFIEEAPAKALCYSKDCLDLGGEIRRCAPWIEDCTEESSK